jgi:hypothetical protein
MGSYEAVIGLKIWKVVWNIDVEVGVVRVISSGKKGNLRIWTGGR